MNVDITQVNTTKASAYLTHDDIVRVLGLAVKVQAGIPSDQAGATVAVTFSPAPSADGKVEAQVDVLVDHNFKPAAVIVAAPVVAEPVDLAAVPAEPAVAPPVA